MQTPTYLLLDGQITSTALGTEKSVIVIETVRLAILLHKSVR